MCPQTACRGASSQQGERHTRRAAEGAASLCRFPFTMKIPFSFLLSMIVRQRQLAAPQGDIFLPCTTSHSRSTMKTAFPTALWLSLLPGPGTWGAGMLRPLL